MTPQMPAVTISRFCSDISKSHNINELILKEIFYKKQIHLKLTQEEIIFFKVSQHSHLLQRVSGCCLQKFVSHYNHMNSKPLK